MILDKSCFEIKNSEFSDDLDLNKNMKMNKILNKIYLEMVSNGMVLNNFEDNLNKLSSLPFLREGSLE